LLAANASRYISARNLLADLALKTIPSVLRQNTKRGPTPPDRHHHHHPLSPFVTLHYECNRRVY